MSSNSYSSTWYELFGRSLTAEQTAHEVDWISRHLTRDTGQNVLDLCCGEGRHSADLSDRGHAVVGIDANPEAIAAARQRCPPQVDLQLRDARSLEGLPTDFDAVVCMWQSFGYFSSQENLAVLASLHRLVRPGGRLFLDVYNAEFFRTHQGVRSFERAGRSVTESKSMTGDRLKISLDYGPSTTPDVFDWQVYTPDELRDLLAEAGWHQVLACSAFLESTPPSREAPRMQVLAESR